MDTRTETWNPLQWLLPDIQANTIDVLYQGQLSLHTVPHHATPHYNIPYQTEPYAYQRPTVLIITGTCRLPCNRGSFLFTGSSSQITEVYTERDLLQEGFLILVSHQGSVSILGKMAVTATRDITTTQIVSRESVAAISVDVTNRFLYFFDRTNNVSCLVVLYQAPY